MDRNIRHRGESPVAQDDLTGTDLDLSNVVLPRRHDLYAWRDHICAKSNEHTFTLKAPTSIDALDALIDLIHHHLCGGDVWVYTPKSNKVFCDIGRIEALLTTLALFKIGQVHTDNDLVIDDLAEGDGVTLSIYQGALQICLKDQWVDIMGFYHTLDLSHLAGFEWQGNLKECQWSDNLSGHDPFTC
ncbi:hypothetical protein APHAL10511_004476 [Amanita phalloides]|nr:hypothetical protein APHAL10511_004476 [Amanita phalloides]